MIKNLQCHLVLIKVYRIFQFLDHPLKETSPERNFQIVQFHKRIRIIERNLNDILGELGDLFRFRIIDLTRQ